MMVVVGTTGQQVGDMAAGGGHPIQSITPKKISMRDCPGQAGLWVYLLGDVLNYVN